jgi:hypothetical protein
MFKRVKVDGNLKEMAKRVFDMEVDIDGGWGYDKESVTIVNDLQGISLEQFVFNLAQMRVYLEMNILQDKEHRYSSINLIQKEIQELDEMKRFRYSVTAMLEKDYNKFIDEYKDGYGKDSFDIEDHFKRRKEATIEREIDYLVRYR